jgi:hypothetical protein
VSSAAAVGPMSADIMSRRVKCVTLRLHHSLKKWVEISRRSSISKARRLAENQHIEAFGAGRLVIRAWYVYCNPRVIIDKARLSQMTLERFSDLPISIRRETVTGLRCPTVHRREPNGLECSFFDRTNEKIYIYSSSLRLNEMKALFVVTASFDI